MPHYLIYPLYTGILALTCVLIVPRQYIRKLAPISIVFGGAFDVGAIFLYTKLLGVGGYINYGPFGVKGFPFFPPITWVIFFILYFYILPNNKIGAYFFPLASAVYSIFFSNLLINVGIFEWNYGKIIVPFFVYFTWHLPVTWVFLKIVNCKPHLLNHWPDK